MTVPTRRRNSRGVAHVTKTDKAVFALCRQMAMFGRGLGRAGAGVMGNGFVLEHQLPPDRALVR